MPEAYLPVDDDVGIKIFPSKHSITRDDPRYLHYRGVQPEFGDHRSKTAEDGSGAKQPLVVGDGDPAVIRNYAVKQDQMRRISQQPHHADDAADDYFLLPQQEQNNVAFIAQARPGSTVAGYNSQSLDRKVVLRRKTLPSSASSQQQHYPSSNDPAYSALSTADRLTRRAYEEHYTKDHGARGPYRTLPVKAAAVATAGAGGVRPQQRQSIGGTSTHQSPGDTSSRRRSRFSLSPSTAEEFTYQDYHKLHHYRTAAGRQNGEEPVVTAAMYDSVEDDEAMVYDEELIRQSFAEQRKSALLENIPVLGRRNPELVAELKKLDKGIQSLSLLREEQRRELQRRENKANLRMAEVIKECTSDRFIDLVPSVTPDGDVIPEWKRQTIAKKLAAEEIHRQELRIKGELIGQAQ